MLNSYVELWKTTRIYGVFEIKVMLQVRVSEIVVERSITRYA